MKTLVGIIVFVALVNALSAQIADNRNSIYVESNLIVSLSISYDRIVPLGDKTALLFGGDYVMGIGFGYGSHWLAPEISLLSFGPRHFLETGVQYAFGIAQSDEANENSTGLRLAYRLQGNKRMAFRATANIFFNIDPVFIPSIGIGYSF